MHSAEDSFKLLGGMSLRTGQNSQNLLLQNVRTGAGTPPAGVKRPNREADHSYVQNAVVMNEWRYTSNTSTSHHDGPKDNVTFFPGIT